MFDRASSVTCSRSTSLRRDCTWLERVPAAEARDKFVELGDFLFALRVLRFDLRANLRFGHHHVVVTAGVSDDGLVVDVGDMGADAVQKMAVVRDHDQHAVVVVQKALQPVNGFEVEVVGGFVEQQRLRMAEQRLGQQDADFLSALQLAHFALVQFVGNVEALQQDGRVGFGGVAVFFADDALEFAQPHAVFVGHLGLGVNTVALFHSCPEALVAHDDRVDHAIRVEGELVLAEHAELLAGGRRFPSADPVRR